MRLATAEAAIAAGEPPVWLCTMELPDGRTFRLATRAIEVPSRVTTRRFQFDPFLSGMSEFEEEMDVFSLSGVGSLTQARIEVVTGADLANLHAEWGHVSAARIEISLLWEGQSWEDRLVVLGGGTVQGMEIGLVGQPVTLSIEATPPTASASVGDDTRDLGTDYPSPLLDIGGVDEMTDLKGCKYQHVYGVVKSIPAYKIGAVSAQNRLILAGHHFARTGASYPVTVYETNAAGVTTSAGTFDVTNGTNASGPIAYVESNSEFGSADGAYTYTSTYGGIAAASGSDRAAIGAEGVVRRLLADSQLPVDWQRAEPALQQLRDWNMGIAGDQEAPAIDILREFVAFLPLIEMTGGAGIWFGYVDPHHAPIEASLTYGQEIIGRVGPMTISDIDALRNSFAANYDHSSVTGEYLAACKVNADNSTVCYLSQQLYGVRAEDPIDCAATSDATAAGRTLLAKVDRLALPRRIVTYEIAPDAYWLAAGSVVEITDPGYSIDTHRAVITKINRAMVPFQATFHLIDRSSFARSGN